MSGMSELDLVLREQVNEMPFGEVMQVVVESQVPHWLDAFDAVQDLLVFYLSVAPFGEED